MFALLSHGSNNFFLPPFLFRSKVRCLIPLVAAQVDLAFLAVVQISVEIEDFAEEIVELVALYCDLLRASVVRAFVARDALVPATTD